MEARTEDAVGIVLAGGGSKRLQAEAVPTRGKAGLLFEGRTFLECVCAAVASAVGHDHGLFVVAAPGQVVSPGPGAMVIRDATPDAGPLAGIRDGLRAARDAAAERGERAPAAAVIASCDVPLLRSDAIRLLVDEARASGARWTVPVVHGHPQVLVSVMGMGMLPRIEAWLATGRRDPRGLLERLQADEPGAVRTVNESALIAVDPMLESFFDIDTPADLERLRAR